MKKAGDTTPPSIKEAFEKFERSIYSSDVRFFRSTKLQDVREAARIIERDQADRKCLRNLRRIKPLLDGLGKFEGALDTLCQGTPYLCYIWAPIKLLLQIADEYTDGFEQLVDAYAQIAQHLPRFDRLSEAFCDQPDFQSVLADIYSDILEFHTHAYRFLRRPGWKHVFDACWKNFNARFNAILRRLARGAELIDSEAKSFDILEAKSFRQKVLEELEKQERERRDWQLRTTLTWLDLKGQDREQEELLEACYSAHEQGTCEWLLKDAQISSWLDQEDRRPFFWLKGKPGSGKTTLASFLVKNVTLPQDESLLHCFYSYSFANADTNLASLTLRLLVAHLIRKNVSLLPHVYDNFVRHGAIASASNTSAILQDLIRSLNATYLVLDGLDECGDQHQKLILKEISSLLEPAPGRTPVRAQLKVLVTSRETKEILKKLKLAPQVSLSHEQQLVSHDMALFTRRNLSEIRETFGSAAVDEVEKEIVRKADGMFLWAQLVLDTLKDQHSLYELRMTLQRLPNGLAGVYGSILDRIHYKRNAQQCRRARQILGWLALAYRPLKVWELCDALVFEDGQDVNEETKLVSSAIDFCKPILEERQDKTVVLVHFSAREFLLEQTSGPYIRSWDVHLDISEACLHCLLACNALKSEHLEAVSYRHILKGFHDLFDYVNQYWTSHLLEVLKTPPSTSDNKQDILRMRTMFNRVATLIIPSNTLQHQPITKQVDGVEARDSINCEASETAIPPIVSSYITFRHGNVLKKQPHQSTLSARPTVVLDDPTCLNTTYRNFRCALEALLENRAPWDLQALATSESDMRLFRDKHGSAPYLCRWYHCDRSLVGFISSKERSKHEHYHEKPFLCPHSSCDFAGDGFSTRNALNHHLGKCHMHLQEVALPRFENQRGSTEFSSTPYTLPLTTEPWMPKPQNGALADYQMQLLLQELQNKRRLLMARQEQEVVEGMEPGRRHGDHPKTVAARLNTSSPLLKSQQPQGDPIKDAAALLHIDYPLRKIC